MRIWICIAAMSLAGVSVAQDRDHWDRDRSDHGRYHGRDRGDYRRDGDRYRRDRDDRDWRRDRGRYDGGVYVEPTFAVGGPIYDLQCEIGNLTIELTNLRRDRWAFDRDRRCRDLEVRIRSDRDRIAYLRR